jgi:NitT/TauT family transport system substrate-binding protein
MTVASRVGFVVGFLICVLLYGCGQPAKNSGSSGGGPVRIKMALNWMPEPEFGGIYAAQMKGLFKASGLEVEILPGGAGAATWQMVASGQVQYAMASADEVFIARARGGDVVALFATYQICPQGVMVHAERGLKSMGDVFQGGTVALEEGLPAAKFLQQKFSFKKVKVVSYDGGVAAFLASPDYAQQCFVTSEPLAARRQSARTQVFLLADVGFNPYTTVLIAQGAYVKQHQAEAQAMVNALREGWEEYLKDPKPANDAMGLLNKTMDAQTFAEAAEAQKPLIRPSGFEAPLGSMTKERWQQLGAQLLELKVIENPIPPEDCLVQWP